MYKLIYYVRLASGNKYYRSQIFPFMWMAKFYAHINKLEDYRIVKNGD